MIGYFSKKTIATSPLKMVHYGFMHSWSLWINETYIFCLHHSHSSGASEPKNMIYMSRLGIWGLGTPFKAFDDFLHAIEKRSEFMLRITMLGFIWSSYSLLNIYSCSCSRGVGAMEIVAMDMKVSGMYIARQLSFSGVSFRIEEITLDEEFKLVYNKAARLVRETLVLCWITLSQIMY